MSSFNNIEPVKLYKDSKKKKNLSLAGPFQGIPLETDTNNMPPKEGFTPRPAVSLRERNPDLPGTGGGPPPPSVNTAPPNRSALFGPGVPFTGTLAQGNVTGGNAAGTQGDASGNSGATQGNAGGRTEGSNIRNATTGANPTGNDASNRTTGSGTRASSTAGSNTTNAGATSTTSPGGNTRTSQAAPARGNVGGFSDIMAELHGRPSRNAPANNTASSTATRSNTTANNAAGGSSTVSTAPANRSATSTVAAPTTSTTSSSANTTPASTAPVTSAFANAAARNRAHRAFGGTTPITTASASTVASTRPTTATAATTGPATGVRSFIGTQSYAERVAEANRMDDEDVLDYGDSDDEDDEDRPRFAPMPPPGSMPTLPSMPSIGPMPSNNTAAPSGSSRERDTSLLPYNPIESEHDIAATAARAAAANVDVYAQATPDEMAQRRIRIPRSRRQGGAAASTPSSTGSSAMPGFPFCSGQIPSFERNPTAGPIPGLIFTTPAAQNDGATGATGYKGPVLTSWSEAEALGPTLPPVLGEMEPWEADMYGTVPSETATTATHVQPSRDRLDVYDPDDGDPDNFYGQFYEAFDAQDMADMQASHPAATQPATQPAHQPAHQPADQPAADASDCMVMDDVQLHHGDREMLSEIDAKDEDEGEDKDKQMVDTEEQKGKGKEREIEGEKEPEKMTEDEEDLYGASEPSSPLSDAPENLVDPREDQPMRVDDTQMPAGETTGAQVPQWLSAFAPPAGYVPSVADPTDSIEHEDEDTPMLDPLDPPEDLRPAIERPPVPEYIDLTKIPTASGALWTTMRTACGAPEGDDSSSSSSDSGKGDGDGDDPADLPEGFDKFERSEREQYHHREAADGDGPPLSPPPLETRADLANDTAAPPIPETVEEHDNAFSGGDRPAPPPPQPAPRADLADDAAAPPVPATVEGHDSDQRIGDVPAPPLSQPAPVADLTEDLVPPVVSETIEWRNTYLPHGESPVQRLLMQAKELRVKQILVSAVTLLAHFAALPESSVMDAADYTRQASRLAADLQVSEALKGRCAYYEGFAEYVLSNHFDDGVSVSPYLYDDYSENGDIGLHTYVFCFRRAKAAQGVYREGTWATEWLQEIPIMRDSTKIGKPKRALRSKKSSSLRQINRRHSSGRTIGEMSSPDIHGNFIRTAAGERMREADARDRISLTRDGRPKVEPIDTSHLSPSLERKRHVKTRSISDYLRKIPGSYPQNEISPESKMEAGESPWKSTPEQKSTRWCVIQ